MKALIFLLYLWCTWTQCNVRAEPGRNGGRGSKWWNVINTTNVQLVPETSHARPPLQLPGTLLTSSVIDNSMRPLLRVSSPPPAAVQHPFTSGLQSNRIRSGAALGAHASGYRDQPFNRLHKKQRRLVANNEGVLPALDLATRQAVLQCQHQFRHHRWNCPVGTADALGRGPAGHRLFGNIVDKACRETAFVYAMTAAAVTHSVARACARGTIGTCSCGATTAATTATATTTSSSSSGATSDPHFLHYSPDEPDWQWGGCSDNVQFGYAFSRRFVDVGEKGGEIRYAVNRHNNEAGRKAVLGSQRRQCKCHGLSGSCAMKTCWMQLPPLQVIGDRIKQRFDQAKRVKSDRSTSGHSDWQSGPRTGGSGRTGRGRGRTSRHLEPFNMSDRPPTRRELVFYDESPDFCRRNLRWGWRGVAGRQCNDTSSGQDGCTTMCCDRGYHTRMTEVVEPCHCSFQWCCEVHCKQCRVQKVEHFCL